MSTSHSKKSKFNTPSSCDIDQSQASSPTDELSFLDVFDLFDVYDLNQVPEIISSQNPEIISKELIDESLVQTVLPDALSEKTTDKAVLPEGQSVASIMPVVQSSQINTRPNLQTPLFEPGILTPGLNIELPEGENYKIRCTDESQLSGDVTLRLKYQNQILRTRYIELHTENQNLRNISFSSLTSNYLTVAKCSDYAKHQEPDKILNENIILEEEIKKLENENLELKNRGQKRKAMSLSGITCKDLLRRTRNHNERNRAHNIIDQFDRLRRVLPSSSNGMLPKSKIQILVEAKDYIRSLIEENNRLANEKYNLDDALVSEIDF